MSSARLSFGVLCLLSLFLAPRAGAQAPAEAEHAPPIVSAVRFVGNWFFPDELLAVQVRTSPNRRFLEIPGATWWLWLYRLGESGKLGRGLSRGLTASGEPPAFLDTSVVAGDVERLRIFYINEGFRQARVSARIDTFRDGGRVNVSFLIEPGGATQIRQIRYEGVEALAAEQREQIVRTSYLRPPRGAVGDSLTFRPRGQRYSAPALQIERQRLLAFLRDRGYAAVSRDSIRAIIIPARPDSFDVVFRINPGPRYRFGDVHFEVQGPEDDRPWSDTLDVVLTETADTAGVVTVRVENEGKLNPRVLTRSLRFEPGEVYNQSRVLDTKRLLEGTGLFSYSNISPTGIDSTGVAGEPSLSHRIDLRTRRRHSVRLESFVLQRNELGGAEGGLGIGAGATYQNVNFLGAGETFQAGVSGSLGENFKSPQAEVNTSLTYPYLTFPFGGLERALDLYDARTRFSFSLLTARREDLKLIIRGRGAARARLELDHSPTLSSLLDLPDLTLNNPDTLLGFGDVLGDILGRRIENGDTTYVVNDPVQREQITQDYTVPSVNSAFRYTLRALNVNPLLRERGYSFESSAEIGGNLLNLLDRFVFSPGEVSGTLPGLPIFRGDRADNQLVYRQYVRFTADYRRYLALSRSRILAFHVTGGIAHPIAVSDVVPFDRRFYTGGASGVRGWGLRALGPGRTNTYQGGEVRLETAAELRIRFLRNMFGANWYYTLFTDVGNVWLRPGSPGDEEARFRLDRFYKQVGVGSGLGVRIVWEFFVARLDLAYRVYDPAFNVVTDPATGEPARRVRGFFSRRTFEPHFGIGHAF